MVVITLVVLAVLTPAQILVFLLIILRVEHHMVIAKKVVMTDGFN